ncbi:Hypothetical protein PSEBR_m1733 [Pseudomonas brassicacearum subsp. brassicacearum NFM421]|uniref:Uncharacterized protein n=1 Tax=Pseudomonas brassicacearum (strain NFM421) TaxID=994484 RepID=F2K727_PSEBN|nr:Hypothetical protein PSEBR_m1733 [Pseudomonas brassicacearum subsp. brassicacearum NFM421]
MGKAHKRADSGVVVGNGARMCSWVEALRRENKQAFVMPRIRGQEACSCSVAQRFSVGICRPFWGGFAAQREQAPSPRDLCFGSGPVVLARSAFRPLDSCQSLSRLETVVV